MFLQVQLPDSVQQQTISRWADCYQCPIMRAYKIRKRTPSDCNNTVRKRKRRKANCLTSFQKNVDKMTVIESCSVLCGVFVLFFGSLSTPAGTSLIGPAVQYVEQWRENTGHGSGRLLRRARHPERCYQYRHQESVSICLSSYPFIRITSRIMMMTTMTVLLLRHMRNSSSARYHFPFLPEWFHGLSGHLMFLFRSTAGFVCMIC